MHYFNLSFYPLNSTVKWEKNTFFVRKTTLGKIFFILKNEFTYVIMLSDTRLQCLYCHQQFVPNMHDTERTNPRKQLVPASRGSSFTEKPTVRAWLPLIRLRQATCTCSKPLHLPIRRENPELTSMIIITGKIPHTAGQPKPSRPSQNFSVIPESSFQAVPTSENVSGFWH